MATIVFGLDGGNWNLLEPWLGAGELPTLSRLREDGTWGVSRSVLPPVTCPNWKCYATSRSPDAHDVYWWELVNKSSVTVDVPDSTSFTRPELWDYFDDEGLDAGVMNLPMSYPPRDAGAFLVAGGPRSGETDYTEPPELEDRIESEFGYRVHPENVVTSNENEIGVDATLDLIESRFDTAHALLSGYDLDFLHLTIFHLNVLQHYYWNGEPTKRAWKLIDDQLGRFLDGGHTVFLMSDHGCTEIDTVFYVNEWLQREGFLTMETTTADYLMRAGLTQERIANLIRAVGLESTIRKYVPRRLVERVPDSEGIKRDNKFDKIDQNESVAVASGQGLIYLLIDPDDPAYDDTLTELIEKLSEVTDEHGRPVTSAVHEGREVYPDGDPMQRPDIVFEQGPGVHTSGAVGQGRVTGPPTQWAAENVREGLFLAHGPSVASAGEVGEISILDIAPSVLYSAGLDVPRDFDGEPLKAVNDDRDSVTYRDSLPSLGEASSDGGDEEVQERLEDLGYLE